MVQEFLAKLSKKDKIIVFLFVGSIFLVFFTLSQGNKKQYYQKKIEKLQQLNQGHQFKKGVLDRYQKFLNEIEKEEKKWRLDLPLEKINENLLKIIQNSKYQSIFGEAVWITNTFKPTGGVINPISNNFTINKNQIKFQA